MITCDYLIIGAGFAGIGLKYKLHGKTILIDKNPFSYKIGESQIPNIVNFDPGLFSLVPKIMKMKSYTRKLGSVFCDSYHGRYASNFPTPIGTSFAFHCEREEYEKFLVKELSIEIRKETILDVDLSRKIVTTDQNTYHFKRYLLDCSGPAMLIANKLNLVSSLGQFEGMKAQWGYWAIDQLNESVDSWANWTVLNKVGPDSWIWQIPIYNSKILSMGMLHRGETLSNSDLIDYLEKRSASCFRLTSIAKNPGMARKPYMKQIHSRFHYSKVSKKCSGDSWILVGDAYCFADPVFSVGSGVAMMEALTIAKILNMNNGEFDHSWYETNCNALLKTVINGINAWYSGDAFDKKTNHEINRTILRGGFSRHFDPSRLTEEVTEKQKESIRVFLSHVDENVYRHALESGIKVYYFDKNCLVRINKRLAIKNGIKPVFITNPAVQKIFEKDIVGKKRSFNDLFLIAELNLATVKDKDYFWKLVRFIELAVKKEAGLDRLYYFHPEEFETIDGKLKIGDKTCFVVIKDSTSIVFFEQLRGKIFFGKELMDMAKKVYKNCPQVLQDVKGFLQEFHLSNKFGENICFFGSKA